MVRGFPAFFSLGTIKHFTDVNLHTYRWLVGCLGFTLETVFQSISDRLPKRGRYRREKTEESKNVQTTPTRTYCKHNRPLPYYPPNCRTPRHWKCTQDNRTTRPPPPPHPPYIPCSMVINVRYDICGLSVTQILSFC